ncbi:MAG: DUF6677 family protein [Planctomycetota bacterium]
MAKQSANPNVALAALLAWIVPGAGHVYLGRVKRGGIIFITIAATFWAGVAMGGALTVDVRTEKWWAMAAMLSGVHGAVAWYRQDQIYREVDREVDKTHDRRGRPGDYMMAVDEYLAKRNHALVYPMDIPARAYAGVAGLLNLLCVFDAAALALMGVRGEPKDEEDDDAADRPPETKA